MTITDDAALDTVVWSSLTGPQAAFARGDDDRRRFPSDVAPFGAVRPPGEGTADDLAAFQRDGGLVAVVTATTVRPFEGAAPTRRLVVDQMVLVDPAAMAAVPDIAATPLGASDVDDMLALVRVTQPGPFGRRTIELGEYIGLRVDGRLLAMGGERMKVPGFCEISAVCVDPACRGRGYAASIMKRLAVAMTERGETPFLHVIATNGHAIALYERLGFVRRRQFHFGVYEAPR